MPQAIVGYCRVSTKLQGHDGLGMEAQRQAVTAYAASHSATILAFYAEVETGRKNDLRNRPQLVAAIGHARRARAVLVIARIDRLARNVFVTSQLLESGVLFVACDNPHANRLTIQILAAMAEHESRLISERIRAANAAARTRGYDFRRPLNRISTRVQQLGTVASTRAAIERSATIYRDLVPLVAELRGAGNSLQSTANALNALGHRSQYGGMWTRGTIYTLLRRENMSTSPPPAWIGTSVGRAAQSTTTTARYADLLAEIRAFRASGKCLRELAETLNARGQQTFRGRPWTAAGLNNLLQRQGGVDRSPQ